MDSTTLTKINFQTLLCWCGVDEGLEASLKEAPRSDLQVVRTVSEFLEMFHEKPPGQVVLSGEPSSDALRLLQVVKRSGKGISVFMALKDPNPEEVRLYLRKGAKDVIWSNEIPDNLPEMLKEPECPNVVETDPEEIICINRNMAKVVDIAKRIAPTDSTVLVEGESGTGKELVASLIHSMSRRKKGLLVKVNCGAIPEPLLESQLYGHEKGSFTGAVKQQKGLFEVADNGTIFLDEIGELGLEMQVKLLRFLQGREFRRVGGNEVIKVNVRVIAATNKMLKEEVARGRFRMDLFYRLNVISLHIPPLRERPEEISILVDHFVKKISREKLVQPKRFSPEAIARLRSMAWPGNVRELENVIERLLLLSQGEMVTEKDVVDFLDVQISECDYSSMSTRVLNQLQSSINKEDQGSEEVFPTLAEVERTHIEHVLVALKWNKMRTARLLDINVKTLYNKIKAYNLSPPPDLSKPG